MTKNQGLLLGLALTLLFTGIAIVTSSTSPDVIIYAFDQNPAGLDEGNEWVTFHNPSNKSVDIGNWTFESTHGTTAIDWIAEGTTLYPGAYCTYTPHYGWLDNSEEAIILRNAKGEEVDRTPVLSDNENDNRYWMRNDFRDHIHRVIHRPIFLILFRSPTHIYEYGYVLVDTVAKIQLVVNSIPILFLLYNHVSS